MVVFHLHVLSRRHLLLLLLLLGGSQVFFFSGCAEVLCFQKEKVMCKTFSFSSRQNMLYSFC